MTDRVPGAPGQYQAQITPEEMLKMQNGEPFTITMTRDDQPVVEGTPYSKATVLPDVLANSLCPDIEDPTPADAMNALLAEANRKASAGLKEVSDPAKVDAFRTNGWIRFYSGDESIRLIDEVMSHAVAIRGDFFSADYGTQTAYTSVAYILQRSYQKKWLPWEWVNPPMTPGVEYRTTERWNGHVVYTMLIDVGNLPNNSVKSIALPIDAKAAIEARGVTSTGQCFPFNTTQISSEPIPGIDLYTNHSIMAITTHSDKSERTAQVTIKYIKEG